MNRDTGSKQTQNNNPHQGGAQKNAYPLDRYTAQPQSGNGGEEKSPYFRSAAPNISLPKGGGALKGIDEKFTVNAMNGTSALQVALPLTPGRTGFTPSLSLQYNSGSGNSEFGLGWNLSLPAIQRKTDKKLPRYNDAAESDVFLLAGAEDLVPQLLDDDGDWVRDEFTSGDYFIKRYRPRIEGLYARIEHITKTGTSSSWWRVITKDNISTYYGLTADGRIADPENETRIFKWLPQLSCDHKGNMQQYEYVLEDLEMVPVAGHERNHNNGIALFMNKYLKRTKYCNAEAFYIDEADAYEPALPDGSTVFWMEAVLDYGDHDTDYPLPERSTTHWPCRKDPFSDFHAGFEIRTYRKCKRVLMFHYFAELDPDNETNPCLVRSLDISYQHDATTEYVEVDFITSIVQNGYKRIDATTYFKKSLPALTIDHQPLAWDTNIYAVSRKDAENSPQGLTGPYQWIDLWGEGMPGILTEQSGGWFYKTNLGDGHFSPALEVAPKPSLTGLGSTLQWQDLEADGRRQVVSRDAMFPGYYELDDDQQWQSFRSFKKNANVDWSSPYTKTLDLDGDGRPDLLLTEDNIWTWYANKGKDGYDEGGRAQVWLDEEKGPRLLLNDQLQSIFLADMNGDGLTDIVRIKNGEVCYWPNMGYGRFGARVAMDNAPSFDRPDNFNPIYIVLADISGTGAADVIYMGNNRCTAWINLSGNALSEAYEINPLPGMEPYSKVAVMDFLGNGTACIVWSSPLPQHADAPMRYIDLMGGKKPYLMSRYHNGMGKSVTLTYKSSSKYYMEDKLKGNTWATRLPFPVQCVENITTADEVSETSYTQSYTYHHGYYDHEEREFRGFGRVESIDSDTAIIDDDTALDQHPVLTKTWYHTGAWIRRETLLTRFAKEYYPTPDSDIILPGDISIPSGLGAQEQREAYRALKSVPLRQEVYALDSTDLEAHPYTVTAFGYCVKRVQPLLNNRYASFHSYQEQSVAWQLERNADDPRILHDLTLNIDEYGNILQSAKVSYPRISAQIPLDTPSVVAGVQSQMLITITENKFTNDILAEEPYYRLRVPYEAASYELHGSTIPSGFWKIADLKTDFDGATEIDFSDTPSGTGVEKRLLSKTRTVYLNDSTDPALPLGAIQPLGLVYQQYQLAFTTAIIDGSFGALYTGTVVTDLTADTAGAYMLEADITPFSSSDTDHYWLPSGTMQYDPSDPAATFFTPVSFTDPWGKITVVTYWDDTNINYYLLPKTVTDALGNVSTVLAYDWRCLQPSSMQDMNENLSDILYDALCMPVAMAVRGKSEADDLSGLNPEDTTDIGTQAAFWTDPSANAITLLGNATWRCVYDLDAQPTAVAMIAREVHGNGVISLIPPTLLIRFSYTDGFGRVAMHKVQAADDPITTDERWIGSGKTVYNNKGKVVMQYEPYFSTTHAYDPAEQAASRGVTPIMHYDPLGRVQRTDLPDGSYTKTEWDAWKQTSYDNNDTVLDSAWYTNYSLGTPEEVNAADKAADHDNTPTIAWLDTLARPFYSRQYLVPPEPGNIAGTDYYDSYVDLDILNNRIAVHDARGLTPLQYSYNMLKAILKQVSIDSGTQYMLAAVDGQPLYAWDADSRLFHFAYDDLRRPITKEVDPGTGYKVLEVMVYGEGTPDDMLNNMRGQLYQSYDGAGLQYVDKYDFKGNPKATTRQYTKVYTGHPDWTVIAHVDLETETYTTQVSYDAFDRPIGIMSPDGSTSYVYEKNGMLYSLAVSSVNGFGSDIVNTIEYDAKGQRTKVQYENGATTTYEYDAHTFRTTRIRTTRSSDSAVLQDLKYWYDPVGNITMQKDDADQSLYFTPVNVTLDVASPNNDYTYDALYRLIQAKGREHGNVSDTAITACSKNDLDFVQFLNPQDDDRMRAYTQSYEYDAVGNMLEMGHIVTGGTANWTRSFDISSSSNKLDGNTLGAVTETYTYDNRGSLIDGMAHLDSMTYNYLNRLEVVVDVNTDITTYYQYDSSGERVRKVKIDAGTHYRYVRKYIGQWEVYDKIDTSGTSDVTELQRETLHIMDDRSRVALIDSPIIDINTTGETQLLRYQFSNHLGTSSLELDDDADIVSYEEYFPFGSTSFQSGRTVAEVSLKRYRYTGKERDEETGLYYHGARYYAPWLGRWCAVDPRQDEMPTLSPYNYGFCNPVKWADSTGMVPDNKDQNNSPNSNKSNSGEAEKGGWWLGRDDRQWHYAKGVTTAGEFNESVNSSKGEWYGDAVDRTGKIHYHYKPNNSIPEVIDYKETIFKNATGADKEHINKKDDVLHKTVNESANVAKGIAINRAVNRFQLEPARGATVTGLRDTYAGELRRGKMTGEWTIRFDNPHGKGKASHPHININHSQDPHIRISNTTLRVVENISSFVKKVGTVATPFALALDAYQLGTALEQDNYTLGKNTQRAAGTIAGGWVGATVGSQLGSSTGAVVGMLIGTLILPGVGTVAGEAIGSIIGGLLGGWFGAKKGSGLGNKWAQ